MELPNNTSERCPRRGAAVCAFIVGAMLHIFLPTALAGPEGIQVVNGDVSFSHSGNTTSIVASDMSIINYSSFDIAKPEIVEFVQPNSRASVLNRISSATPTNIEGTLRANGSVFFVNPAGVYIGEGAQINVTQLVASALNITDADFINGRMNFTGGDGTVTNRGDILAERVYLVGKHVVNTGNISCPAGYAVLAAGESILLREQGSEVMVKIESSRAPEPTGVIQSKPGVLNEGTVEAAGGTITLAAGDIFSQAISNVGSLSASLEAGDAGRIRIKVAASTGLVGNGGSVEAKSDNGKGGIVTIEAAEVINSGTVDVTGSSGGNVAIETTSRLGQFGTIHADGNTGNGGNIELKADDVVALNMDSLTTANAATNGDGGEVIVYSPDTTLFHEGATIEAKGGNESGDGGSIEVSGKRHVEVFGQVDASAKVGEPGTFQIDPMNINIQDSGASMDPGVDGAFTPSGDASTVSDDAIEEWLNGGTSVEIIATGNDTSQGNITQDEDARIEKTTGGDTSIKLMGKNITLDGGIISESGKLEVILDADEDVTLTAEIETNGGGFTSSGNFFNVYGPITTAGGDVNMNHAATVVIEGGIDTGSGSVDISTHQNVQLFSEDDPRNIISSGGGDITVTAGARDRGVGQTCVARENSEIYMDKGFSIDAGDGTVTLTAEADIWLSDVAGETVNVTACGPIAGWERSEGGLDAEPFHIRAKTAHLSGAGSVGRIEEFEGQTVVYPIHTEVEHLTAVSTRGNIWIVEADDVALGNIQAGDNTLSLEVTRGRMTHPSGIIRVGDPSTDPDGDENRKLTLKQTKFLDMRDFTFQNQGNTDITLESSRGAVVAVDTVRKSDAIHKPQNAADQWRSVTVTADDEILLEGPGDIIADALASDSGYVSVHSRGGEVTVRGPADAGSGITLHGAGDITTDALRTRSGNISVHSTSGDLIVNGEINAYLDAAPPGGGVELLADVGRIYSALDGTLNVSITGYSDDLWAAEPLGVELPGGEGRAGIVVISHDSLHLGPKGQLSTYRRRDDALPEFTDRDDRDGVHFLSGPPGYDRAGDPIDVSVYVASTGHDVTIDSQVSIYDDGGGAMVVDARERVDFSDLFAEHWVDFGFPRLEVVSRASQTLVEAVVYEALPGAREMLEGKVPTWIMDAADQHIVPKSNLQDGDSGLVSSKYVLRGGTPGQVLAFAEFFAKPKEGWRLTLPTVEDNWPSLLGRHVETQSFPEWAEEQERRDREPPLVTVKPLQVLVLRGFRRLKPGSAEASALMEDDIIETPEAARGIVEFGNHAQIIMEPRTRIKIRTQGITLVVGKIWFRTINVDPSRPFEISMYANHIVKITGTAEGSVSVSETSASPGATSTASKRVVIGPILAGQVRVYGSGMPPEGILTRRGDMMTLEGGSITSRYASRQDSWRAGRQLDDRLREPMISLLAHTELSRPCLFWKRVGR